MDFFPGRGPLCLAVVLGLTLTAEAVVYSPRAQVHRAPRMNKHAITLPAGDPDWVRRPHPDFATPRGRSQRPRFKAGSIETRDLVHRPPLKPKEEVRTVIQEEGAQTQ